MLAVSILMLSRLVLSSLQTPSRACVSLSVYPLAINAVHSSTWTITISNDHVVGAYVRVVHYQRKHDSCMGSGTSTHARSPLYGQRMGSGTVVGVNSRHACALPALWATGPPHMRAPRCMGSGTVVRRAQHLVVLYTVDREIFVVTIFS